MTKPQRFVTTVSSSLLCGSLLTVALLEAIDPHSRLGDFVFWPQHTFRYFMHFGANNPVAPRLMLLAIVLLISAITYAALRTLPLEDRIVSGMMPAIVILLFPFVIWTISRRFNLGLETPFALLMLIGFVGMLFFWQKNQLQVPLFLWLALWIVWCSYWGYLYQIRLDPIMLHAPVIALCAGVTWSWVNTSRATR